MHRAGKEPNPMQERESKSSEQKLKPYLLLKNGFHGEIYEFVFHRLVSFFKETADNKTCPTKVSLISRTSRPLKGRGSLTLLK